MIITDNNNQMNMKMLNDIESNDYIDWLEKSIQEEYIKHYDHKEFKDIEPIGYGSFGNVVRATWKNTNCFFALKSFNNDKITLKEVVNELKLQKNVDYHENILQFRGITKYEADIIHQMKKYMLVLDYADSGTLNNYLKDHFNELDWVHKYELAKQLASAVSCIHDEDIIHRDLHAGNVLVHKKSIKLADFGLSRKIAEASSNSKIFGVIPYVDPKTFNESQNYKLSKKSDVYSIGVLMWQISSGLEPYKGKDYDLTLALSIVNGKRERIIDGTPIEYSTLYEECWKYEPDERPNIKEVVSTLNKITSLEKGDTNNNKNENKYLLVENKPDLKSSMDLNKDLEINSKIIMNHQSNESDLSEERVDEYEVIDLEKSVSWIQPKLDVLRGILNDETLELSRDKIHDLIGEYDGIGHICFTKSLVNKQGDDGTEDVKSKQQEVATLWEELQSNILKAKYRLEQALQVKNFKEKVNEVLNEVDNMSNIVSNVLVEDIANADTNVWQTNLDNFEHVKLFSLKEDYGSFESKKLENLLREVVDVIEDLKKLTIDKVNEAEAYQASQIKSYANDLQMWIGDSMATLTDAKSKHGIMVGNSEEINRNNFSELTSFYERFTKELPDREDQFQSIKVNFNDILLKVGGIRELQDVSKLQSNLDQSWDNLDLAVGEFKNFIEKTGDWHYQHDSIYRVENEILEGLEDRISIYYNLDEVEDKIKMARLTLDDAHKCSICNGHNSRNCPKNKKKKKNKSKKGKVNLPAKIVDDLDYSIDSINRGNLDDHYNKVTKRLNELSISAQVARIMVFRANANRIMTNCYEETAMIKLRHEELENSGYYALEVDALEIVIKDAIDRCSESEEKLDEYDRQANVNLKKEVDKINTEIKNNHIQNVFSKVTAALEQLSDAFTLECNEINLLRRVHNHIKTAQNISNWMNPCKIAVLSIQAGTFNQEEKIADLEEKEEKVADFQIVIDQFIVQSYRVFTPEVDGTEVNGLQSEGINPKIKDFIQAQTNRVVEDWRDLRNLLSHLRTSLNASKESQEVSRAIDQMKERALNIESSDFPTKDDIGGELDEIQAEIDYILGPRIKALDEMINNLTENDSVYIQQRYRIAEVLKNLANIVDTKRRELN